MKKIILILAGALFINLAAFAQEVAPKQDTTVVPSENYRQGMTAIKSSDLPAPLQTTLQDAQYKGWETGTFYTNESKDTYVVEIKDASAKTTTYRFDANGQPLKERDISLPPATVFLRGKPARKDIAIVLGSLAREGQPPIGRAARHVH